VRVELKKVTWPRGPEVVSSTVVVIIVTLFVAIVVGIFNRVIEEVLFLVLGT